MSALRRKRKRRPGESYNPAIHISSTVDYSASSYAFGSYDSGSSYSSGSSYDSGSSYSSSDSGSSGGGGGGGCD